MLGKLGNTEGKLKLGGLQAALDIAIKENIEAQIVWQKKQ